MKEGKTYTLFSKIAIAVLSLAVLLWISSMVYFRADLTEDGRYTLTDETKDVLENLDDTIRVTVYLSGDIPLSFVKMQREISDYLNEFQQIAGKDHFLVKFIDPQTIGDGKNSFKHTISRLHKEYGLSPYTIQEEDESGKLVQRYIIPGMIISTSQKYVTVNLLTNIVGNSPEEQINKALQDFEYQCIKAIKQLTATNRKNVAFLTGHGETSLLHTYSATVSLLDLYNVDRVSSKQLLDSLDKYDALIIVGPTQPFTETDKFIIDQYMMHNGNVMFLTDNISVNIDSLKTSPFTFAMPKDLNFADLLFNIGIRINANILLDNQCAKIPMNVANFGEQPRFAPVPWYYYPLLKPTTNHPITQNIDVVKAEFASTIDTLAGNGNLSKTVLLTSSAYSRIVPTPNTVGFNVLQNRPDKEFFNKYYIPTGVLIEGQANSLFLSRKSPIAEDDLPNRFTRKNISEQNRIIVVSDGDIIRNEIEVNNNDTMPKPLYYYKYFSFDQRTYMGNMDFLINAVNHLCGDSDLISIRSREITIRLLNKNRIVDEKKIWQVTNVVLPIIFIWLIGLVAYIIRKRKYSQTC